MAKTTTRALKTKSMPLSQVTQSQIMDPVLQLVIELVNYCAKNEVYQFQQNFMEDNPQGWLLMTRDDDISWSFFYGLLRFPGKSVMEFRYDSQRRQFENVRCYNAKVKTGWQTFVSMSLHHLLLQMNIWGGLLRGFFLRVIRHHDRQISDTSPISEPSSEETGDTALPPLKPYDADSSPYGYLPPIDRLDCIADNLRI